MSTLDEILDDATKAEMKAMAEPPEKEGAPEPKAEEATGEEPPKSEAKQEVETQPAEPKKEGEKDAPPASDEENKQVPLSALEAERKGRQDWKEKATRAETERDMLRQEIDRLRNGHEQPSQREQQNPFADPQAYFDAKLFNERLNMSEQMLRAQHEDVDEVLQAFEAAVQQNPALGAELRKQPHPWKWAYDTAKRFEALQKFGDDPAKYEQSLKEKYREELREEIMKEMQGTPPAQPGQPPQQQPKLQPSLATARSAGPRTGPQYTGPTPLDEMLK